MPFHHNYVSSFRPLFFGGLKFQYHRRAQYERDLSSAHSTALPPYPGDVYTNYQCILLYIVERKEIPELSPTLFELNLGYRSPNGYL